MEAILTLERMLAGSKYVKILSRTHLMCFYDFRSKQVRINIFLKIFTDKRAFLCVKSLYLISLVISETNAKTIP